MWKSTETAKRSITLFSLETLAKDGYKIRSFYDKEVAIGPVTGRVLQSYRSGSHVKLNLQARAQCYKHSGSDWSFRFCFGESISTYRDLQKINGSLVYTCIEARELWKEWRVAVLRTGLKAVEVKYLSSKSSIILCVTPSILFLCFGKTEQRFRTKRVTVKCWTYNYSTYCVLM